MNTKKKLQIVKKYPDTKKSKLRGNVNELQRTKARLEREYRRMEDSLIVKRQQLTTNIKATNAGRVLKAATKRLEPLEDEEAEPPSAIPPTPPAP